MTLKSILLGLASAALLAQAAAGHMRARWTKCAPTRR